MRQIHHDYQYGLFISEYEGRQQLPARAMLLMKTKLQLVQRRPVPCYMLAEFPSHKPFHKDSSFSRSDGDVSCIL